MRRTFLVVVLAILALAVTAVPSPAKHDDDHGTKLEGRVTSINRAHHTFRLRDRNSLGTFTIRVNRATQFDRLRGFSALRVGRQLQVTVSRTNDRLFATKIETPSHS